MGNKRNPFQGIPSSSRIFPKYPNFLLIFPLYISFIINVYIASGISGLPTDVLVFLVRLEGISPGIAYMMLISAFVMSSYSPKIAKSYVGLMGIVFVALWYFSSNMFVSMMSDNAIIYMFGDLYRSVIPFVSFAIIAMVLSLDHKALSFAFDLRNALIIIAILGALFKIYMIAVPGVFYGGGANQYSLGSFLITYLFVKYSKKISWEMLGIVVLVVLSILSLKRGIWISMASVFLIILMTRKLVKISSWSRWLLISVATSFVSYMVIPAELYDAAMNSVISRFEYTVGGGDESVRGRINEWYNVREMLDTGSISHLIFGYGHGAEFFEIYKTGGVGSEGGSVHHIHSTWILLLFRNGIIGVIIYLTLFFVAFKYFVFYWADAIKKPSQTRQEVWLLGFSASVELIVQMMNSIQGNIAYGYAQFSIFLFLAVAMRRILARQAYSSVRPV